MPVLKARNKELPSRRVSVRFISPPDRNPLTNPKTYLSNAEIRLVYNNAEGIAFSTTNKLVLTLEAQPLHDLTTELEPESVFWDGMATRGVGIWNSSLWFKDVSPSPTGFDRDQYNTVTTGPINVTLNGNSVEIEVTDAFVNGVKNAFSRQGKRLPQDGMLRLVYERHYSNRDGNDPRNRVKEFLWVRCSFEPLARGIEVHTPRAEAGSVEAQIADFTTSPTAFENLHVPQISGSFVYNFFEIDEQNLNSARRKSYALKKLSEIPRYVELTWNPVPAVLLTPPPLTSSSTRLSSLLVEQERERRRSALEVLQDSTRGSDETETTTRGREAVESILPGNSSVGGVDFGAGGGGSRHTEESSGDATAIRMGGSTFTIGGQIEEEAGVFGSFTKTAQLARGIFSQLREDDSPYSDGSIFSAFDPTVADGPISSSAGFVGGDTTTNLGLSDVEDVLLDELIRDSDQPDAIAGPNEFSRYIGYVLLKERYNPEVDQFEPVDLISVLDRRKTRIIDTKIAFGDTYRYKIRSIYKFVNVDNLPLFRDQDTILSRSVISSFDGGQPFRHAFYFDSKFSEPLEIPCRGSKRPDPPYSIKIFPNSKNGEIFITWSQKQPERDIIGFNIYRRIQGSDGFTRLNRTILSTRQNFYLDNQVDFDIRYVYCIESVDVHNNTSKLSIQNSALIKSQDFTVGRTEEGIKLEVDKPLEVDQKLPKEQKDNVGFRKKLKITVNPLFGNLDREVTYLLKVRSLDTFSEKDIKINFQTKIITHIRVLTSNDELNERRDTIQTQFEENERERFGITRTEILRRSDRRTRGRNEFEE